MKVIVGLGNVGAKYAKNRHNAGFMAIDKLALRLNVKFSLKQNLHAFLAVANVEGQKVYLVKPITMMNDSGIAVKAVLDYFGGQINDLIVFVDDIDRDYGQLRIKKAGASGGHNGLKSIEANIGSREFLRIRIGTGRPAHTAQSVIKHVLGDFTQLQMELVQPKIDDAVLAALDLIQGAALNTVTNRYNN
ncbi:aminoacyl-tRNA hydrolase [Oenococcus sicerae]|uniref:aminoacyl-tRNA hydrolase n=1 Tax=Oenococcus sicerae TaxID=2203724 RepID=UPI0010BBFF0B|nr:Peptidyl-tRNA hydrolase {ECO:0000255/HAMAP-Rule:MF_00083} [Oenococcus sicerae]